MTRETEAFDLATCRIEPGVTLIEASAGTGKTYSLTALVLRLLLEKHVSGIGTILVMTFTNAATAELVERIRRAVREAVGAFERGQSDDAFLAGLVARHGPNGLDTLRAALRDLDDVEVTTIHGFCRRLLEQNALEIGVPFEMDYVDNDRPMLHRAAEDFWRRTVYPAGPLAARVIADEKLTPASFIEAYVRSRRHPRIRIEPAALALDDAIAGLETAGERDDAGVSAFVHALRVRFIRDVDALFEREKRVVSTAGYDDLLHRLHACLADEASSRALRRAVGSRFEAVMIDEFQDTDAIQLEIFEGLFKESIRFYVGDPKQAIYGFRGADVFAYLRAKASADRLYTMTTNYRSERALIDAVDALFTRNDRPFVLDDIPFVKVDAAGRANDEPLRGDDRSAFEWIWLPESTNKETGKASARLAVVHEIVRLLEASSSARIGERPAVPRDIAVLVRTNFDAAAMQRALLDAGVPAVVSQAGSVFDSEEAGELEILMRAVLDPRRSAAVRAALATRVWGLDAAGIAETSDDDSRWQALIDDLDTLRETWLTRGFAAMASRLLDARASRARLLASEGGQRRLTNMLHLIELGQQAIVELALSPDGLVEWLARTRADEGARDKDVAELRLESDDDAVEIVTIHKSKGLEYEIVFVPFAWDAKEDKDDHDGAIVHDDGEVVLHFPELPAEIKARYDAERASEDARVAYVALTRAKHRCYVAWGALGKLGACNTALARLIDPSLPESSTARNGVAKEVGVDALSERWRAELDALCRESSGAMAIREVDESRAPHWQSTARPPPQLALRVFPASALAQLEPWRVASFSSFCAPAPGTAAAARTVAERPDHVDAESEQVALETTPRGIFAFARGARAGTCLHEIFEKTDFTRSSEPDLAITVTAVLARHGFAEPAVHKGAIDPVRDVTAMVRDVLSTKLPGETFALSRVTRARKLSEWQFYLPMAAVSAKRFADVLGAEGARLADADYVASLRALGDRRVEGFLTGFVDLVFMHDDRWYVLDWKSNHLGNDVRAYGDTAIGRAMREHHYLLQYQLYVLALHRYLGHRLRGYDYERNMGGVYYAFVRGIRPSAADSQATGWYHDRPSRELVEALDSLVSGSSHA